MYTLCPHCQSAHPINAHQLGQKAGAVVCASCGQAFNALHHLFDDYPDASKAQPERPVDAIQSAPVVGRADSSAIALELPSEVIAGKSRSALWAGLLALLIIVTALNALWVFRAKLPQDNALVEWARNSGIPGFEAPEQFRDTRLIHLITRDIHSHPTRAGILVLSATFINIAPQAQPYPNLLVTLSDADNMPLGARSFSPDQYLSGEPDSRGLLQPDQNVPILLEFADPGERASGFELEFY